MAAISYQNKTLGPVVRAHAGAVGPGFLVVRNNAQLRVPRAEVGNSRPRVPGSCRF